jgi:hypothetical protein
MRIKTKILLTKSAETVTLHTGILKVPSSDLGLVTNILKAACDFPQSLKENDRIVT